MIGMFLARVIFVLTAFTAGGVLLVSMHNGSDLWHALLRCTLTAIVCATAGTLILPMLARALKPQPKKTAAEQAVEDAVNQDKNMPAAAKEQPSRAAA